MNRRYLKFDFLEKVVFALATAYNLSPVLAGAFFPTMDGAAHSYNAYLIGELLFNNEYLNTYYELNTIPVPTGQDILSWLFSGCFCRLSLLKRPS